METIRIDNLEVKSTDFGQVEHGDIFNSIIQYWQDGWRLPTIEELDLMYEYKNKNGQLFDDKYYWSSSYYIKNDYSSGAWVKHFGNGRNFYFGELFPAYVLSVKSYNDKECFKNGIVELEFCDGIELLQYDFGLVDWQEAENIVNDLGDGWRIPTIHELDLIKPIKLQLIRIHSDYYWGVTKKDGIQQYDISYFGEPFRFSKQHNLKNNLFLVRSKKTRSFLLPIPEGRIII